MAIQSLKTLSPQVTEKQGVSFIQGQVMLSICHKAAPFSLSLLRGWRRDLGFSQLLSHSSGRLFIYVITRLSFWDVYPSFAC